MWLKSIKLAGFKSFVDHYVPFLQHDRGGGP